jgi:hypothetical protein
LDPANRNQLLSPLGGETTSNFLGEKIYIRSKYPSENSEFTSLDGSPSVKQRRMVTFDPNDLIGRTLLKDSEEYGQQFRACVVHADIDKEDELKQGSNT